MVWAGAFMWVLSLLVCFNIVQRCLGSGFMGWNRYHWNSCFSKHLNWNPCFSKHLNDWGLSIVETFFSRLQDKAMREENDRVIFKVSKNGIFSIKSPYFVLETVRPIPFPLSIIWNSWVPSKASFFVWEACWGKVLMFD